jgi:hypothetical protein
VSRVFLRFPSSWTHCKNEWGRAFANEFAKAFFSELATKRRQQLHQGDQIGRIFAHWAIVYFEHFSKFSDVAEFFSFAYHFPQLTLYITFNKKWVWLNSGQFFRKLIWSPCCCIVAKAAFQVRKLQPSTRCHLLDTS